MHDDKCPKCGNADYMESCGGGTWLFRVRFCGCGWDTAEAGVAEYCDQIVRALEALPVDERPLNYDTRLARYKDPETRSELAKAMRTDSGRSWTD